MDKNVPLPDHLALFRKLTVAKEHPDYREVDYQESDGSMRTLKFTKPSKIETKKVTK